LETFTKLKDFVPDPHFEERRNDALNHLNMEAIDAPIMDLIKGFSKLSFCFTQQCCYGHFAYGGQLDPHNLEHLPMTGGLESVEYRIAYVALCLQNHDAGRQLFSDLEKIPMLNPENIQFGCAEWFWESQVNSFALQVEPQRHMFKDSVVIPYQEALHIQHVRDSVFSKLRELIL
jgi:hypothetical protein